MALLDDEDHARLCHYKWACMQSGRTFYARRYVKKDSVFMHRDIIAVQKGQEVDHINGNGLDNRRENLRACTHAWNTKNMGKNRANATSKYVGVSWNSSDKRWRAQIRENGRPVVIGCFKDENEAAKARDEHALRLNGPYARLNFPLKKLDERISNPQD